MVEEKVVKPRFSSKLLKDLEQSYRSIINRSKDSESYKLEQQKKDLIRLKFAEMM